MLLGVLLALCLAIVVCCLVSCVKDIEFKLLLVLKFQANVIYLLKDL